MSSYNFENIDDYDYLVIKTDLGDTFKFLISDNEEAKKALLITY